MQKLLDDFMLQSQYKNKETIRTESKHKLVNYASQKKQQQFFVHKTQHMKRELGRELSIERKLSSKLISVSSRKKLKSKKNIFKIEGKHVQIY